MPPTLLSPTSRAMSVAFGSMNLAIADVGTCDDAVLNRSRSKKIAVGASSSACAPTIAEDASVFLCNICTAVATHVCCQCPDGGELLCERHLAEHPLQKFSKNHLPVLLGSSVQGQNFSLVGDFSDILRDKLETAQKKIASVFSSLDQIVALDRQIVTQENFLLSILDHRSHLFVAAVEDWRLERSSEIRGEAASRLKLLKRQQENLEVKVEEMHWLVESIERLLSRDGAIEVSELKELLERNDKVLAVFQGDPSCLKPCSKDDIILCENHNAISAISTAISDLVTVGKYPDHLEAFEWDPKRASIFLPVGSCGGSGNTASGSAPLDQWRTVVSTQEMHRGVHYFAVTMSFVGSNKKASVGVGNAALAVDLETAEVPPPVSLSSKSFACGDRVGVGINVDLGKVSFFVSEELVGESFLDLAGLGPYFAMVV